MVMKMKVSAKRLARGEMGSVLTGALEALRREPRGAASARLVEISRRAWQPPASHAVIHGMIRKLTSGDYRFYSRKKDPKTGKRRNLGTFRTRAAAQKHERAVQFFKHGG